MLLPAGPALIFLAIFFVVPAVDILSGSVIGNNGGVDFSAFLSIGHSPAYLRVLWNTLEISVLTAVFAVALGYPLAYLLDHLGANARERWLIWIMIPFWTSYIVKTYAWLLLLSHVGLVTQAVNILGVKTASVGPSLTGVLIGMVHGMLPLAILTMLPIMQGISRQLPRAAESLGAGRAMSFFTVFLPLSSPGIAAGALLVFVTSLGFFIVPSLLGTPGQTMIAQMVISAVQQLFNLHLAGALSAVLLACSIIVFVVYDRLAGLGTLAGGAATTPLRKRGRWLPILFKLGYWLTPLARCQRLPVLRGYSLLLVFFLMLPILLIIPIAFTRQSFAAFPPELFSLHWFHVFLGSSIWRAALFRSLRVGAMTALLSTGLGIGAAYTLTRSSSRFVKLLFVIFIAPLVVPRIVIATGLLYFLSDIHLIGTDAGLVLGHTVLAVPYVVVTLAAGFRQFDWRLNDAARLMGASVLARFRTILLPILAPSIAAAMLFAFIVSFDDVTIAIFVSGGINTTLPKEMWDNVQLAVTPTLSAVSTVLIFFVAVTILAASAVKSRIRKNA